MNKRTARLIGVVCLLFDLGYSSLVFAKAADPHNDDQHLQQTDTHLLIEVIHSDRDNIRGQEQLRQQGIQVNLYNLDDPKRLLARLGQNLPPNQVMAKAALEQRFAALGKHTVQAQFQSAYQALIKATDYGVDRYPAIVFNHGQVVIYGLTDLKQAWARYRQWRRGQK
jgi:integrating conjugative element protein (TIGR03757 family)